MQVAEDEWGKKAKWVVYRFHDFNFTVEFILSHHQVPIARRDNDTYLPDVSPSISLSSGRKHFAPAELH